MRRLDIKTGFLCNNNCMFCVQAHKKKQGNKTTEEVKKQLELGRKKCTDVVFTGGEPTIRQDIFELVSYAKSIGYRNIQIQTNARVLSYSGFAKKLVMAGATEFSPAIHGSCSEIHDSLTCSEGSFIQTLKAIKNIVSLRKKVITNTVVVKQNYEELPDLARLLINLRVSQYQFAYVHGVGNAEKNYDKIAPKISDAISFIHKGLQLGIDNGVSCMAEALPYCVMKGYEKYVSEQYIPATEIRDDDCDPEFEKTRLLGKTKFKRCGKCKYDSVCEGPYKEYVKKFGDEEFIPVL